MKAVILTNAGSTRNFQLAEVPDPEPEPQEVRIRVQAAGFNPADYKMRIGQLPLSDGPVILGGEVSGFIDAVGNEVDQFSKGEAVCAYLPIKRGGYAELVCTPQAFVARKPDALSFAQAAAVPLAGLTALQCVDSGWTPSIRSAFVAGASGGVGSFAVQLLRHAGVHCITVSAGSDASVQYIAETLSITPDRIVRYDCFGGQALIEQIIISNDGEAFDLALDLVGGPTQGLCCAVLDLNGSLLSIVQRPEEKELDTLCNKCAAFRFVSLKARARNGKSTTWNAYSTNLNRLLSMLVRGDIHLPKMEDVGPLSVESVRTAHGLLEDRHVQGKLVMSMRPL